MSEAYSDLWNTKIYLDASPLQSLSENTERSYNHQTYADFAMQWQSTNSVGQIPYRAAKGFG